jgi:hypothetical protein
MTLKRSVSLLLNWKWLVEEIDGAICRLSLLVELLV